MDMQIEEGTELHDKQHNMPLILHLHSLRFQEVFLQPLASYLLFHVTFYQFFSRWLQVLFPPSKHSR